MPGHGSHWEALYDLDEYAREKLPRDWREGRLICRAPCMDVVNGSERLEEVACLRYGNGGIVRVIDASGEQHRDVSPTC